MAIWVALYMHFIDPIALLWVTVLKATTGPVKFCSKSETQDHALKSYVAIAHPQCLSN